MPVSCSGKKPFGMIMYRTTVSISVPRNTQSVSRLVPQHALQAPFVARQQPVEHPLEEQIDAAVIGPPRLLLRKREHIIGVKVSAMHPETRIATVTVTANSRNSRPTMPPISSSGMNTATSERLIETMVKPISPAPLSAASSGVSPVLDMADDVLQHDDRIVHHEADGDRQPHQRQVVEAVAEQIHHRERPGQRQRHGDAGDDRRPERCAETERSPRPPGRW